MISESKLLLCFGLELFQSLVQHVRDANASHGIVKRSLYSIRTDTTISDSRKFLNNRAVDRQMWLQTMDVIPPMTSMIGIKSRHRSPAVREIGAELLRRLGFVIQTTVCLPILAAVCPDSVESFRPNSSIYFE
jgi:hypothetical protein